MATFTVKIPCPTYLEVLIEAEDEAAAIRAVKASDMSLLLTTEEIVRLDNADAFPVVSSFEIVRNSHD
jgi:hypothetical protein